MSGSGQPSKAGRLCLLYARAVERREPVRKDTSLLNDWTAKAAVTGTRLLAVLVP